MRENNRNYIYMGKIYLVRHGQSEDNAAGVLGGRRDSGLTALGAAQARRTAEELKSFGIGVIFASPLKRAYDTARIIADKLGIEEIISDERLMERDFGVLSGHPYADIPRYAGLVIEADEVRYFDQVEGAEGFPSLLRRAGEMVEVLRAAARDRNVLVATHADTGKMLLAAFQGRSWEEGIRATGFGNGKVVELE